MKPRILLIAFFTLIVSLVYAQEGGISGKVVNRTRRVSIDGAKVVLQTTPYRSVFTNMDGTFTFKAVPAGDYKMTIEAGDFQDVTISVKVGETMKDIGLVSLSPEVAMGSIDDAAFSEFDTESSNDAQVTPIALSASKDVFDNIAGYKFGDRRFRPRGVETSLADVSVNGIYMNDALTGYTPWSLWTGLNEVTRNQEVTSGLTPADYGIGDVIGTTNINMTASNIRKGFRSSVVNASGQYRLRVMATYASGEMDNGWSYALSASTRQGGNDWVKGVYYNAWAYYGSVEKKLDYCSRLALTVFGSPTIRGVQSASTQEVYDLVGSNYYNANWGYQAGDKRNARVRNNHEPVAILNYSYEPNEKFKLSAAVSYRFGRNGYSALDWYDAQDPRPDYYRNLPSYYEDDPLKQEYVREGWMTDWNIRQIDWDRMYNVNYNSTSTENVLGTRSKYVVEERMTNQNDINAKIQIVNLIRSNSKIAAGVNYRWNRTEYFKRMKDLLGGSYWLDVDQFAERDFGMIGSEIQNNLNDPNRLIQKGDKYGYDYYAHIRNVNVWANYGFNTRVIDGYVGAEGGHNRFWREGLYRKGLFPNNSYGDAKKQNFWTYMVKGGLTFKISKAHQISINAGYTERAPFFQDAYISPRTRNSTISGVTTEKSFSGDLNYMMRLPWIKMRLTGFYTTVKDQTKLISFYDDLNGSYTNFAMSGINQLNTGLEFGFQAPLVKGITLQGALNYGYYKYTSNPLVTQTVDNSDVVLVNNERVYWKNYKIGGTPMTAANLGLNYRSSKNLFVGVDVNYYDAMYIDMNPLYRTDYAHRGLTDAESQQMAKQEMFPHAFLLNANIGKSWYINRIYNLGFSLEVKNILNNQSIKTGGYEQMRLHKVTNPNNSQDILRYTRFDSKYFYMFGTTYYLNVYFRF